MSRCCQSGESRREFYMTKIIGTKGKLAGNSNPMTDLMEAHLPNGVQRSIPQNYYERFEQAFVTEANEFTDAVINNKDVPVDIESSYQAIRIGVALQESLRSQKKIWFDLNGNQTGEPQTKSKLQMMKNDFFVAYRDRWSHIY